MGSTDDQSLFAWGWFCRLDRAFAEAISDQQALRHQPITWKQPHERVPLYGLLAASPSDFRGSGDVFPADSNGIQWLDSSNWKQLTGGLAPVVHSSGITIHACVRQKYNCAVYWDNPVMALPATSELAILHCSSIRGLLIAIVLVPTGHGCFSRTASVLHLAGSEILKVVQKDTTVQRHITPPNPFCFKDGDIVCSGSPSGREGECCDWYKVLDIGMSQVYRLRPGAGDNAGLILMHELTPRTMMAITLRRSVITRSRIPGALQVSVSVSDLHPFDCHAAAAPSDTWHVRLPGGFGLATIKVDRMSIDTNDDGNSDAIDVVSFSISVNAPFDSQSGAAG
jgi:hypothetical protein